MQKKKQKEMKRKTLSTISTFRKTDQGHMTTQVALLCSQRNIKELFRYKSLRANDRREATGRDVMIISGPEMPARQNLEMERLKQ